jgi:hypothetical protein
VSKMRKLLSFLSFCLLFFVFLFFFCFPFHTKNLFTELIVPLFRHEQMEYPVHHLR